MYLLSESPNAPPRTFRHLLATPYSTTTILALGLALALALALALGLALELAPALARLLLAFAAHSTLATRDSNFGAR